jgi:galactokinase
MTTAATPIRAFGPGRVNLIGEHTDYNDGLAIPFALELGVTVIATPVAGNAEIEAAALDLGERDRFSLKNRDPRSGWRAFVRGAAGELQAAGVTLPGMQLEISGNLPRGSGMSSSAALETSLCLAMLALAERDWDDRIELAKLCQRIEHDWVGAQTGLMDQLASLFGEQDRAVLIDFRELTIEPVPLVLGGYELVTLDSGQAHSNAASGYNQRRQECVEAAHRMGKESLRDAQIQDLHLLPDVLERRARHVISENARVIQSVVALREGDLERLGLLLDESHASLRDDFEISTAAVEATVKRLKDAGAIGARLLGGGFGGNILGLMPPDAVLPEGARVVHPSAGAHLLA